MNFSEVNKIVAQQLSGSKEPAAQTEAPRTPADETMNNGLLAIKAVLVSRKKGLEAELQSIDEQIKSMDALMEKGRWQQQPAQPTPQTPPPQQPPQQEYVPPLPQEAHQEELQTEIRMPVDGLLTDAPVQQSLFNEPPAVGIPVQVQQTMHIPGQGTIIKRQSGFIGGVGMLPGVGAWGKGV